MRELMCRELAGQDGSRLVELAHGRRVGGGDRVEADPRMAGRADPGGRIDVLQRERDTVQRAAIAARHDFALGLASLVDCPVGGQQQVCVELRVERLGAPDQRGRQLDRRKPLLLDQPRRLGD